MKKKNIFWGVFFLLGAVLLIVSQLGLLSGINLWTALLSILLAAVLIKSILCRSCSGILFSLAFGCIIYAKPLGLEAITPWPVLCAAALGSIGCGLLFGRKRAFRPNHHEGPFSGTQDQVSGDAVELETSFGSSIKYVHADRFQRARVRCSFGAMKVYFDNALIQDGAAVIELDVSFSGVELYIPRDWELICDTSVSLGAVETPGQAGGGPRVTLTGSVSFSGVEVFYL